MFDPNQDVLKQIMGMADDAMLQRAMRKKQPAQPPMAASAAQPAAPQAEPDADDLNPADAKALADLYAQEGTGAGTETGTDTSIEPGKPSEEVNGPY